MSYDLSILKIKPGDKREDVTRIMRGQDEEQDEYHGADFTYEEYERAQAILVKAGFVQTRWEPECPEFEKGCVGVDVGGETWGISMPYWEEGEGMLPEIQAVVRELCTGRIVCWDPQVGDFVERGCLDIQTEAFRDGLAKVQGLVFKRKPWWRFW